MGIYSVDALSISKIGDLLVEQLGDEAADYTFPEDFEKAIVDIGFNAMVYVGDNTACDLIVIGNGIKSCVRFTANENPDTQYKSVTFVGSAPVNRIPYGAFFNQKLLKNITIPSSVRTIDSGAFRGSGLTSVVLPDGVTSLGINSFNSCVSLTDVYIPDSVATIAQACFQGCVNLESVRLPPNCDVFGGSNSAFYGLPKLATAGPEDGDEDYNIKFSRNTDRIFGYALTTISGLTRVVIPDGVTSIGTGAMKDCPNLASVYIPDSVIAFGNGVFYGCRSLTSVVANSVNSLSFSNGDGVFYNCTGLQSVSLPACTVIYNGNNNGYQMFGNCSSLESLQLGSVGVTFTSCTNGRTFEGCTNSNLVITVYTASQYISALLTSIRNGATNATIVVKAAVDTEYNGVTYSAGDTILTSEVSS